MHDVSNQMMFSRWLRRVMCALVLGWLGVSAQAQTLVNEVELMSQARRWVNKAIADMHANFDQNLRMEASLGALDSRLRLSSCARVEPYLPPGTRLWGRTRLGLRCIDGASKWNVFLPVTVRALGPAWVVRRDVASGASISEADMMRAEVDWAEENSAIVTDESQWLGQTATRALGTGQALRQNMVRAAQVFQAGTQVRVVADGPGYQITSDGQALAAGVVGQLTRVRMDNGRIMSAMVLDARTVRLEI